VEREDCLGCFLLLIETSSGICNGGCCSGCVVLDVFDFDDRRSGRVEFGCRYSLHDVDALDGCDSDGDDDNDDDDDDDDENSLFSCDR